MKDCGMKDGRVMGHIIVKSTERNGHDVINFCMILKKMTFLARFDY